MSAESEGRKRETRGRKPIDPLWVRWIRSKSVNEPQLTVKALERQALEEAKRLGRNDAPSYRTIQRRREEIRKAPETEQREYRYVYWPESFERGDLPMEAQSAFFELMRLLLDESESNKPLFTPASLVLTATSRRTVSKALEHVKKALCEADEAADLGVSPACTERVRENAQRYREALEEWFSQNPASDAGPQPLPRPSVAMLRRYWHTRQAMPDAPVDAVVGIARMLVFLDEKVQTPLEREAAFEMKRHFEHSVVTQPDGEGDDWADIRGPWRLWLDFHNYVGIREKLPDLEPDSRLRWYVRHSSPTPPTWIAAIRERMRLAEFESETAAARRAFRDAYLRWRNQFPKGRPRKVLEGADEGDSSEEYQNGT